MLISNYDVYFIVIVSIIQLWYKQVFSVSGISKREGLRDEAVIKIKK